MAATFGYTVMAVDPPSEFIKLAELVDRSGFEHMWVADSSLHAHYVYSYLTLVATHTKRVKMGPNCTHPYTRHPAINMNAIATIDEISGGRAIMNLAAGDRPVTEVGYQIAKPRVVRQMVEVCRRLLGEEKVDYVGEAWSLHQATLHYKIRSDIPIYITATGPKMLQMAGEVADGILFMPGAYPESIKFALSHIEIGAREAGRALADMDLAWCGIGAIDRDRKKAIEASRFIAAWFPQMAPKYAEIAGIAPELAQKIRDAYSGGHFHEARAAAAFVPDEIIQRFAPTGTPEEVRKQVQAILNLGITHIEFFDISSDHLASAKLFADEVMAHLK
jgi:5,10-methylenetetrahydromethanopterin reductase